MSDAGEFEQWLEGQRTGLRRAVAEAAWRSVDALERSGDAGLVAAARKAWTLEPTNEEGARRLMHFVGAADGRTAALRVYDDLVEALRRELEAEPSAETRALAEELKQRVDPPRSQAPSTPRSPPEPLPPDRWSVGRARRFPEWPASLRAVVPIIVAAVVGAAAMLVLALQPNTPSTTRSGAGSVVRVEQPSALPLPLRFRRDTVAYRSYLRGLALLFRNAHAEARDSFASLTEREPLYAPAFAGLAHAYALMVVDGSVRPANGMPRAEAAARRGLALIFGIRLELPGARGGGDVLAVEPAGGPSAHRSGYHPRSYGSRDSCVAGRVVPLAGGDGQRGRGSQDFAAVGSSELDLERSARPATVLARQYLQAEATFRRTLQEYPPDADAYYGLSSVYRAMGRMRDAQAMRRAATEVEGDSLALAAVPLASSDSEAARMFAARERREFRDIVADAARATLSYPADGRRPTP